MNYTPFILVDVFAEIAETVRLALGWTHLNYQYGYITELDETLQQDSPTEAFRAKSFPLLWIRQPFTIIKGNQNVYGFVPDLTMFLMNHTDKNWKAKERMENNFKPILYPLQTALLSAIDEHPALTYDGYILPLEESDFYYWGDEEKSYLTSVVDCIRLANIQLKINHDPQCPFKNF